MTLPFDNKDANKITYDLNGGTENIRNQRYYLEDVEIYAPTRDGYTFVGWTGSNGTIPQKRVYAKEYDENGELIKQLSGDLHFKANWQKNS